MKTPNIVLSVRSSLYVCLIFFSFIGAHLSSASITCSLKCWAISFTSSVFPIFPDFYCQLLFPFFLCEVVWLNWFKLSLWKMLNFQHLRNHHKIHSCPCTEFWSHRLKVSTTFWSNLFHLSIRLSKSYRLFSFFCFSILFVINQ